MSVCVCARACCFKAAVFKPDSTSLIKTSQVWTFRFTKIASTWNILLFMREWKLIMPFFFLLFLQLWLLNRPLQVDQRRVSFRLKNQPHKLLWTCFSFNGTTHVKLVLRTRSRTAEEEPAKWSTAFFLQKDIIFVHVCILENNPGTAQKKKGEEFPLPRRPTRWSSLGSRGRRPSFLFLRRWSL